MSVNDADVMSASRRLIGCPTVDKIGLPSADHVVNEAKVEYGHRVRQLGFQEVRRHPAGRPTSAADRRLRLRDSLTIHVERRHRAQ
jgi:hypothetical protein